jgi:hypothetical protein
MDKLWAKNALDLFRSLESDNVPDRIKKNRDKCLVLMETANTFEKTADDDAYDLIYQWYHYFDKGFKSKYPIDGLLEKITKLLAKKVI